LTADILEWMTSALVVVMSTTFGSGRIRSPEGPRTVPRGFGIVDSALTRC
jgi:hypothetical protein